MKIKFGALVTDGRNKIGGHVASKNRAGSYLRTKVTPVNPQTSYQSGVRSNLSYLAKEWALLTVANRESWNSAVEDYKKTDIFGDIKVPSGFNLFVALNLALMNIGEVYNPACPPKGVVGTVATLTPTIVAATSISLAYTGDTLDEYSVVVVEATSPQSQGKNFLKNQYRKIGQFAGDTASPYVATAPYVAKFGAIPDEGKKIGFRMRCVNVDTGELGPWTYATEIVPAV
jgi:hypothetical protein